MKGTIIRLPEGNTPGRIRKDDAKGSNLRLTKSDFDAAPEVLDLRMGAKIAFDEEQRAGFMFAVNLRDPENAEKTSEGHSPRPQTESTISKSSAPQSGQVQPNPKTQVAAAVAVTAPLAPVHQPKPGASPALQASACDRHQPPSTFPGTRGTTPAPYTFVPIHIEGDTVAAHLGEPVLHDGKGGQGHISGELRVEIHALTPLLAGQHRYDWGELRSTSGDPLLDATFRPAKKILEPAIVDIQEGRVSTVPPAEAIEHGTWKTHRAIIPATSIKGSIRQAIGAILNAPMERVAERYLSYRPNVDTSNVNEPRYKCFAAVVKEVKTDGSAEIKLLTSLNAVLFVESPDALIDSGDSGDKAALNGILEQLKLQRLQRPQRRQGPRIPGERPVIATEQNELERGCLIASYNRPFGNNDRGQAFPLNRLEYTRDSSWTTDREYLVCHYACGIDGSFRMASLARAQHERKARDGEDDGGEMTARHYFRALVPKAGNSYLPSTMTIGTDLVGQHAAMLRELADSDSGHFSRLPRSFWGDKLSEQETKDAKKRMGKDIQANRLRPYQLIYIEAEVDPQGNPTKVLSFGSHFRYRWRYSSSVREIDIDPDTGRGTIRTELKPAEDERIESPNDAYAGGKLSGARLLFGYVADQDTATDGIGTKSFSRLAGHIAINHALEVVDPEHWQPEKRFLWFAGVGGDARFLLPLRILGSPKPSAVEHYIKQEGVEQLPAATITYGDLAGDPGGALNGRKFYRHQPTSRHDGPLAGNEPFLAEDEQTCRSDQATLARLVSRPGSCYRYTLRFRDLREWELGALLVAIQPSLLEAIPEAEMPQALRDILRQAPAARGQRTQDPLFAIKLGYGRPLGFGSVNMRIGEARILGKEPRLEAEAQLPAWRTRMIKAFLGEIRGKETGLVDWLTVSRYAGQPLADYPRDSDGEIYGYHTKIRICHAKKRRNAVPMQEPATRCPQPPDRRIWSGLRRSRT